MMPESKLKETMTTETQKKDLATFKAQRQSNELLETLNRMESEELDAIKGWDATPRLENIRAIKDLVIDANEKLNILL